MRSPSSLERKLNKHATTILIGGIFFTFSILLFLSFCKMPCEDPTYALMHEDLKDAQNQAFWKGSLLSPKRSISCFLVITVISAPKNVRERDVVRDTWGKRLPNTILLRFSVGMGKLSEDERHAITREKTLHNDLILLKINDSFDELTFKVMETYKWVDRNVDFKFLLKADEDSFVRIDALMRELKLKPNNNLYWGFFDGRAHAKQKGKWEEKEWIICDRYLPYALGGGYILSSDLIHYLSSNSKLLKLFKNEDVSVGAWLGPLDINRVHDPRFDTEYKSRGCKNSYLVTHKISAMQMREYENNLQTIGHLCSKEFQVRKSYIYNWSNPPSKCCERINPSVP